MGKANNPHKTLLSVEYLDDDILMSAGEAWTYVKLPLTSFEFLSDREMEGLANQMTLALTNLTSSSSETVDVHLRLVNKPFDAENWAKTLDERAQKSNPTPGWEDYLAQMEERVADLGFKEKEVFLGVKLGLRSRGGKATEGGTKDIMGELLAPLKKITSLAEKVAAVEDLEVSPSEVAYWHKKAHIVKRTLEQSYLNAVSATALEMAWVIAHPFWPLMPQPRPTFSDKTVWGQGELVQLVSGTVIHRRKNLEIVQTALDPRLSTPVDLVGYSAALAVSRFPEVLQFPAQEPWIHFIAALSFSVDFSSRFSIVPPLQVKKDVSKKLADARDQAQHIAETGSGVPLHIREQVETAATLEYEIDKQRMPWAYARHRMIVTGASEEALAENCRKVIEDYRELGIDVVWPTGDQLNLHLEATPGDKVRVGSYYQRQDLAVISGGMPTAAGAVGDLVRDGKGWQGPYIGYTRLGVAAPATLAPNASIAQNHPPGIAITGAPGGGKALALNTPLLTPNGWTTMGEVAVGNQVYGVDGKPCNVVAMTEIMFNRPCYTIEFRNGEVITADAEHEWLVQETRLHSQDDIPDWSKCTKYTTEELFRKQVFHGENSEPSWLGTGEKSAVHHTIVYSIPHTLPLTGAVSPQVGETFTADETFTNVEDDGEGESIGDTTDFYLKGVTYFLNDYLNDEDCPANWAEHLPVGDLNYDFGTNCADASPQTAADIPQQLIDEKFRKYTENLYPQTSGRGTNNVPGARIVDGKYVNGTRAENVSDKDLSSGEGTPLIHSRFLETHFPSSTAENPVKDLTQSKPYYTSKRKTLANEENEHSIALGILLTASSEQKEHFIRGIVDAYNRCTPAHVETTVHSGVITLKNEMTANNLATLFNMLGYGTQHGRNDTELFPSSLHLHETSDNNAAAARNSASARDNTFSGNIFHSTHTPSNSHTGAHVGQAENTSWFLAYTAGIAHEIVSITPTRSVPVKCVQVDGPHNLYLAGHNLIPTHNSFLAFTLAYQMALQGIWTIYIDPKADAKPMGDLSGLGSPRVFDLRHGNDGMLDPFSLGENPSESKLLALETTRLLLGGSVSEEREEALLNAIEKVGTEPNPSLTKVVDNLLANTSSAGSRNLGAVLRTLRDLPFARLCFSATTGQPLRPEDGLTIITLLGLDLPTANTKPEDYSYENRLAVSVMYLLTRYARKLMLSLDKSHPKAICIDEAWAVASTPQGAKLIPEVARMGRSHNTALLLVSQNAGDLMDEKITNNLSTKFAFRSSNPQEIRDILTLLGVKKDEGYENRIQNLRNGQCVMQDASGRVNVVQVDAWNRELFDTFNTNPETRGKK